VRWSGRGRSAVMEVAARTTGPREDESGADAIIGPQNVSTGIPVIVRASRRIGTGEASLFPEPARVRPAGDTAVPPD